MRGKAGKILGERRGRMAQIFPVVVVFPALSTEREGLHCKALVLSVYIRRGLPVRSGNPLLTRSAQDWEIVKTSLVRPETVLPFM